MSELKKYRAGNWLRGFFEGEFNSIEEAWSWLSKRFLLSFPTETPDGQRSIYMEVKEMNPYGFNDWMTCFNDYTEHNDLDREEVLERCKHSMHTGI